MCSTVRAGAKAPALRRARSTAFATALLAAGCAEPPPSPPAVSLVRGFSSAEITGSPETVIEFPRLELGFDAEATIPAPDEAGATRGWVALHDVENLRLEGGRLRGKATGELPIVAVPIPQGELPADLLGSIEIDLGISSGSKLGVLFLPDEEIDVEELLDDLGGRELADLVTDLEPGDPRTYKLTEVDSPVSRSTSLGRVRHLGLAFFGAEGAEWSLGPIRWVSRTEQLARIPAGVGWQGLADVYRETIVTRAPERVTWSIDLGAKPWFDVAIGSPEGHPATYRVEVEAEGTEPVVLERTVTEKDQWHPVTLDLAPLAGRRARLSLSLHSEEDGRIGFWGSPAIRHRGAPPQATEPTVARAALSAAGPPRGVVLMVADTLRSDHLDAWGYQRPTAPTLSRLAAEGARFADNVSQGTWTKVAVPSILTSLYPSTHGIYDIPHRVPASVTTLAEVFREAGYATFHTSSVLFSGRNSNLQQGVEVLHERASVDGLDGFRSKTARTYVDRVIEWLETHHEQPFFVFLHAFDPHSPFRPFEPYDRRWLDDEALSAHEAALEKVEEVVEVFHDLPTTQELEKAGVEAADFLRGEHAWYDASIRAMDVEVARLFERLDEHGLGDDVLFAFIADHGEEFLEHGRSWHGHSVYGDMINVPMVVRWPGVVPAGLVVERTTQSIDLMPTLLELARLPVPEEAQGRSLVPLMAAPDDPTAYGGGRAPVFSERREAPGEEEEESPDAYAVVHDGWKLIWNVVVRDERPELELFDHRADPLNLADVASEHPEKVAQLQGMIKGWRAQAEAAQVTDEGLEDDLSAEEIEELKALGYLN